MEMIKRYIKNNKGRFFNNNYNIYKSTIAKVISLENVYDKTEKGTNDIEEKYYIQTMVVKVKNGQYKGQQITLKNSYSSSMLMNEKYKKGDDLFISINENSSELSGSIIGLKRDKFIVLLIGFFVIALVAVAGRFGIFTLCTLIANIVAFIYFIKLYVSGKDFMLINVLMIIFFSVVTLLILGGFSRKNIGAILSTLITTFLIFALYKISLAYTGDLHYELMDYIAGPNDLENIFLSGVLVGCLGAVMDVSITVNSAVNELVNAAKSITLKQLIKSIREIGHDIMGTMINVLMFSYIGGSLSIVILKIINGYNFQRLIQFDISFEIIRFLVGAIGIVSAVPISACVALLFFRKGMSKNDSVANNSIADVNDSSRRR